ncbi:A24 family peptidase [Desulfovibrio inopinatus]|uniref:A24 family peptidase n=1 Tax=Desulfovibrio inopinatus TaxID=102109 RepID=UPI0004199795|nr:prepilin peptidase [Desulfovibrio inopinatus]
MLFIDPIHRACVFGLLFLVAMTASYSDITSRRIPNLLTYPSMLVFLLVHFIFAGVFGLKTSAIGLVAGMTVLFFPYLLHVMGAGDVKLMGVVGAALGTSWLLTVFIFTSLAGGVIAIIFLILRMLSAKREKLPLFFPHLAPSQSRVDTWFGRFCYGPAIGLGAVATMAWQYWGKAPMELSTFF